MGELLRTAKWASLRREFHNLRLDDIMHNWEAIFPSSVPRVKRFMLWVQPLDQVLIFNADGAARGKPSPMGIGVLSNIIVVVLSCSPRILVLKTPMKWQ